MSNSTLVNLTMLSPNHSGKRKKPITRITVHCTACLVTAKRLGEIFQPRTRNASCNYGIGTDLKIVLVVDESMRSWCSSSNDNDQQSVTIEAASSNVKPYEFAPGVYDKCIDLCVDICQRNGKKKVVYIPDMNTALKYKPADDEMLLTFHRWFSKTKSCPGDWFMQRAASFAQAVNNRLNPTPAAEEYYIIKKGDRFDKIAKAHGLTRNQLKALNPQVKNINLIYPGQMLRVK